MNSSEQAKNSFKTFLVTFSIALALVVAVYFVATDVSTDADLADLDTVQDSNVSGATSNESERTYTVTEAEDSQKIAADVSVFEQLANQPNSQGAVLQATDDGTTVGVGETTPETTSTPVPDTGDHDITIALIASATIVGFGAYMILRNPRKLALASFEDKVSKKL